jgi:predicted HAD superfamily Cof-like phosphohydrolase
MKTTDILSSVLEWQQLARPVPDDKGRLVALGVHFEEISEMFTALGAEPVATALSNLATAFKTGLIQPGERVVFEDLTIDRKEMLDALCDQIVTATGVAHMLGMDITTALARVNDSNWSKFVDGKPVFDANGKITKGSSYAKPDLEGLY